MITLDVRFILGSAEKRIINYCKASYDKNAIVNASFLNHQSFSADSTLKKY